MRVAGLLVVAACVDTASVSCPDGVHTCPEGTVCAAATTIDGLETFCVAASQLGCTSTDECDANGTPGSCHEGVCLP